MADVVTFGLAVLHVAGTRLVIFARKVNSDSASTGGFSFKGEWNKCYKGTINGRNNTNKILK